VPFPCLPCPFACLRRASPVSSRSSRRGMDNRALSVPLNGPRSLCASRFPAEGREDPFIGRARRPARLFSARSALAAASRGRAARYRACPCWPANPRHLVRARWPQSQVSSGEAAHQSMLVPRASHGIGECGRTHSADRAFRSLSRTRCSVLQLVKHRALDIRFMHRVDRKPVVLTSSVTRHRASDKSGAGARSQRH
jgi:hypothetical protein